MRQPRQYSYVGPEHLKGLRRQAGCLNPASATALPEWLKQQLPPGRKAGLVPVTYVIDCNERLWIADRRSEHVACADGGPVLAAGEMVFSIEFGAIEVAEITNQSTGFCPKPDCWNVVSNVLDQMHISRPESLTHAFEFRRCPGCLSINVIKDGIFECDICGRDLPPIWNFSDNSK